MMKDRNLVGFANAAATAVSGIAMGIGGLGIGGGLLLGAIFFKEELEEVIEGIKDFLPDSEYSFMSPEWVGSWGDSPAEVTAELSTQPDNDAVNTIVNDEGQTLAGLSPWEAYGYGSSGRQAEYDYRVAEAATIYTAGELANWLNYPSNAPPPQSFSLDGYSYQVNLRVLGARRRLNWLSSFWQETDPQKMDGYIYDPIIDFCAGATYNTTIGWHTGAGRWSSRDRELQAIGKRTIETFMNWQAPPQSP